MFIRYESDIPKDWSKNLRELVDILLTNKCYTNHTNDSKGKVLTIFNTTGDKILTCTSFSTLMNYRLTVRLLFNRLPHFIMPNNDVDLDTKLLPNQYIKPSSKVKVSLEGIVITIDPINRVVDYFKEIEMSLNKL